MYYLKGMDERSDRLSTALIELRNDPGTILVASPQIQDLLVETLQVIDNLRELLGWEPAGEEIGDTK